MDLLDKVLLEWSVRCEKGYPDFNNEQDLAIFESMFGFSFINEVKHPFNYLSPEAQELGKDLISKLNLNDDEIIAHAKNRIIVYTDRPRQDVFKALRTLGYEKDAIRGSSAGGFRTPEGIEIIHKSQTSVGDAGLDNEDMLVKKINEHVSLYGPLNITLQGTNKKLDFNKVTKASGVGRDTGDNKKADVLIVDSSGENPISIKKDGAFRWSSAMTTHGDIFHKIIGEAFEGKRKDLVLIQDEENPRLLKMVNPENDKPYGRIFVINVPNLDFQTIAFGSDNAKVVQRTFEDEDFKMDGQVLKIKVTKIYTQESDFSDDDFPVVQFERNASKATKTEGYVGRGITLRTVPMSVMNKATSRANNLIIDYNKM